MQTNMVAEKEARSNGRAQFADERAAHAVADGPVFDIYVARGFAQYLWVWLEDAGAEYGVIISP